VVVSHGPFDERFFPRYFEEVDFCLRCRRAADASSTFPESEAYTRGARVGSGSSAFLAAYHAGRVVSPWSISSFAAPMFRALRTEAAWLLSLRRRQESFPVLAAYAALPRLLSERREIESTLHIDGLTEPRRSPRVSRIVVIGIDGVECRDGLATSVESTHTPFASAISDRRTRGRGAASRCFAPGDRSAVRTGQCPVARCVEQICMSMERFARGHGRALLSELSADGVVAATVHASRWRRARLRRVCRSGRMYSATRWPKHRPKAVVDVTISRWPGTGSRLVVAVDRGDHFSAVSNLQAHALSAARLTDVTGASAGNGMVSVSRAVPDTTRGCRGYDPVV